MLDLRGVEDVRGCVQARELYLFCVNFPIFPSILTYFLFFPHSASARTTRSTTPRPSGRGRSTRPRASPRAAGEVRHPHSHLISFPPPPSISSLCYTFTDAHSPVACCPAGAVCASTLPLSSLERYSFVYSLTYTNDTGLLAKASPMNLAVLTVESSKTSDGLTCSGCELP